MRKIFKKAVAIVAAAAMMIGSVVAMPTEAKAAEGDKEIILVLSKELSSGDKVIFDIDGQSAGITCDATVTTELGWGRDQYEFTKDSENAKVYKITINGDVGTDKYCNMQFVIKTSSSTYGFKYYPQDGRDIFNSNDKVYCIIDAENTGWPVVSAQANDPLAITSDECEEAIDAIGTLVLNVDTYKKIKDARDKANAYEGSFQDISNYSKLVEAENKFSVMVEKAAGELNLYVNVPDSWNKLHVYSFGKDGAIGNVSGMGNWPGIELTEKDANNTDWYKVSLTINGATNMLFTAEGNDAQKTADILYVSAGTYWYTINEDNTYSVSSTKPANWNEPAPETTEAVTTTTEAATTTTEAATTTTEAATTTTEAATTTTEAATTTTETATTTASNETTGATTTASNETTGATTTTTVTNETSGETEVTTTVKEDSKTKEVNVRVKLDSSLGWEKVCLYVWDENGANIAAWPGTEMTKDGQYYTAKVTVPAGVKINMIVNNGNGGDNNQTKDLENIDISSGSVEISLAADLTATVTPVTGDTIMILPVVVAMLALGCVVVALNAKKANR